MGIPWVPIDSDGNDLPDKWDLRYFGRLGVDPNADEDGDGMTNREEYVEGTDPCDPASVLVLDFYRVPNVASNIVFCWPSATGRVYTVRGATNLLESGFPYTQIFQTNPPFNVVTSWISPNVADTGFFDIQATWPNGIADKNSSEP